MSQIARSSEEQSSGIAEINTAVANLDQSTQQNAAMFEETTAASFSLASEANVLSDLVKNFDFEQSERSSGEAASASIDHHEDDPQKLAS